MIIGSSSGIDAREREYPRGDLTSLQYDSASSFQSTAIQQSIPSDFNPTDNRHTLVPSPYTSFSQRTDSTQSNASTAEIPKTVEDKFAQYTNAPPPYTKKQYEGKSEAEENSMRLKDYAKELSRMMGRQLVGGWNSGTTEPK